MKNLIAAILATTALAGAAQAQDITEFRIGVLGGENAQDRLTSTECYRAKAEELLGVPVKVFTPADYDGVIQGLLGGTIDMAWLGASGYAKTYLTDPEAVEPVLVKVNTDGSYGYHSIGFARKDSGITSLEDMQGKKLVWLPLDRLCPQRQRHHLAGRHAGQKIWLWRSQLDQRLPDPVDRNPWHHRQIDGKRCLFR